MKSKINVLIFPSFLLFLICIIACRKGNDEPNPSTQEYNRYFVCYYNNTFWSPCDGLMGSVNYVHGEYHTNGDYFLVWARIACSDKPLFFSDINLKFKNLNDTATYTLNNSTNQGVVQGPLIQSNGLLLVYNTDSMHTGKLVINKYENKGKNLSGEFYFDAFNSDSSLTVKITKGKFINVHCVVY